MDIEELEDLFKDNSGFFLENPDPGRSDLNAFVRLNNLVPGNSDIIAAAEHDTIYLDVSLEQLAEVASEDDVIYLIRHGVCLGGEGLYMHV